MAGTNDLTRYDRQELIEGWNQKKLHDGSASIVGSGPLARHTALSLAALGVGNVRIIDDAKGLPGEYLLDIPLEGEYRVEQIAGALEKVNPTVHVTPITCRIHTASAQYFLKRSNSVVDATNDSLSKEYARNFCAQDGTCFLSGSANRTRGKIIFDKNFGSELTLPMFRGREQGDLVSLALGAVIAEEVKKSIMNGNVEALLTRPYDFNVASRSRFHFKDDREIAEGNNYFSDKKILLVGAGALGCFLGPATIINMIPEAIDIVDYDVVEEHNLNRQVCHYNAVGKPKAESLAQILSTLSQGRTKIRGLNKKFTPEFDEQIKYDIIFDAVDSFMAKSILHNYAIKNKIHLISGGTDFRAASVLSAIAGKTACLNCQIDLERLALKTEIIRRTSCIQAPNPSVIMTNQIAAAFMVDAARCALRPDVYGEPINGEIKYLADFDSRGGITTNGAPCDCFEHETREVTLPEPERVQIVEREVDGRTIKEVFVDGQAL